MEPTQVGRGRARVYPQGPLETSLLLIPELRLPVKPVLCSTCNVPGRSLSSSWAC